jgi:hypothetical protein
LALSTPVVIMNIFPMFNSFCLNLSFKSRHWQYFKFSFISCLFDILFVCVVVFCIFVLIFSVMWVFVYTLFWLNPSQDWLIFCHVTVHVPCY